MRTPTTILTSTTHLATAAEAICDQFELGRAKKSRVLNILAGAIAGPKLNWGYLTGHDGIFTSPTSKGEPPLALPAQKEVTFPNMGEALALADTLETGAASDIWYDAKEYDDQDGLDKIEAAQAAMQAAAALLRKGLLPVKPETWSSTHSHWDEHEDYPAKDWRYEVENNETRLSYAEWVDGKIEQALYDEDLEADQAELDAPPKPTDLDIGISTRSEFYAIAPPVQLKLAEELALQSGGYSWVLWTPSDPESELMFVGDSPESVRAQFNAAMAEK